MQANCRQLRPSRRTRAADAERPAARALPAQHSPRCSPLWQSLPAAGARDEAVVAAGYGPLSAPFSSAQQRNPRSTPW